MLISIKGPILVKTVDRTIELALYIFIGKCMLTAAEKGGFLGELHVLKIVSSEKAKSCYSFTSMADFVLCLASLKKLFLLVWSSES